MKSTSVSIRSPGVSSAWMPASRSRRSPACTSAASSCSRTSPSSTISDLHGKSVGIAAAGVDLCTCSCRSWRRTSGSTRDTDINWVTPDADFNPMELFAEGKVDAFLGGLPKSQELRARKIGRVILNTATDRAVVAVLLLSAVRSHRASSANIRSPPSASCAPSSRRPTSAPTEPETAAQRLVDGGFTDRYDYALQTLTELPLRQLARVRLRALAALLRAPAPRRSA